MPDISLGLQQANKEREAIVVAVLSALVCLFKQEYSMGHIEGERVGTPLLKSCIPIDTVFKKAYSEPFTGQKCNRLPNFAQSPNFSGSQKTEARRLDPDTDFRLAHQRSHCSCLHNELWSIEVDSVPCTETDLSHQKYCVNYIPVLQLTYFSCLIVLPLRSHYPLPLR